MSSLGHVPRMLLRGQPRSGESTASTERSLSKMENDMGNAERSGAWRQLWDEDRLLLLRIAFWAVLVVTFSVLRGKWLLKGWRHRFVD
jgi:hypothetical protein